MARLHPVMVDNKQEIPIEFLNYNLESDKQKYSKKIFENEIEGIKVDYVVLNEKVVEKESFEKGYKIIYLFLKGEGSIIADNNAFKIAPDTVFLPNALSEISINVAEKDSIHFLKISCELTEQDIEDLKEFPKENTEKPYFAKYMDCEPYTESIKSAETINRTILSNKYIPRIAMGTVETIGPDKVAAHDHPMLEQLFLGLSNNRVTVFADDAKVLFPEFSLLHIPLGSSHSVEVEKGNKMYYLWMDFFFDKKGEDWLNTHNAIKK